MLYYDAHANKTYDDENLFIGVYEAFHDIDGNDIAPYLSRMLPGFFGDVTREDISSGVALSINIDPDGKLYAWSGPYRAIDSSGDTEWEEDGSGVLFFYGDKSWGLGGGKAYFPEEDDDDIIVVDGQYGTLTFRRSDGDRTFRMG